jgi:hypothetical protein
MFVSHKDISTIIGRCPKYVDPRKDGYMAKWFLKCSKGTLKELFDTIVRVNKDHSSKGKIVSVDWGYSDGAIKRAPDSCRPGGVVRNWIAVRFKN